MHSHTVHLALGALLSACTMCGTGDHAQITEHMWREWRGSFFGVFRDPSSTCDHLPNMGTTVWREWRGSFFGVVL